MCDKKVKILKNNLFAKKKKVIRLFDKKKIETKSIKRKKIK